MQFEIDPDTGELVRARGAFVRIDGVEAIVQSCRLRLQLHRREVLLDQSAGMRYVGLVLEKGTPQHRVEAEVEQQLSAVPGVVSIDNVLLEQGVVGDDGVATLSITVAATVSIDNATRRIEFQQTIVPPAIPTE